MNTTPIATVVGGGIAGLASAASLLRHGWRVRVVERAAAFGEVGAGLAITRNGMAALDAIGAGTAVRDAGFQVFMAGNQNHRGRWLMRIPAPRGDGAPNGSCGVHRRDLHSALLAAADGAELLTDAPVTAISPGEANGEPATVTYRGADGEHQLSSDLVVAADGINSTIREALWPGAKPRYSGKTSWRGVLDHPGLVDERFVVVWGPDAEFGALRINPRQVYWYGYIAHPADAVFADESATVAERFADWPSWVREIIAATPPKRLLRHDVHHLPSGALSAYTRGRTVLVGDAAHPMLPTMGQGANSALEDGACVGPLLGIPLGDNGIAEHLAEYDRRRVPRCRDITRRSELTARIGADLGPGWRQKARDLALRLTPTATTVRKGSALLEWTPP
ncbi:MAG TPA: FAD-dependent monooxygenase [Stackebrandtia sp.]|jgi:2-polyprenyl-6-methoxyphenol hydroxylase-like FAD-dependent oxidoreductase|uniref:FAD-dependent monooxygenase n=1 Tax=Stackebrandtia sp. TaxID=2023065 RepID=UPI002D71108A|nr:FAD-dependent monooxygenase [Stackebrandtia sp.]HZE38921.1 FAD-dependent monooxygenase [Stackebrandtia sp.]